MAFVCLEVPCTRRWATPSREYIRSRSDTMDTADLIVGCVLQLTRYCLIAFQVCCYLAVVVCKSGQGKARQIILRGGLIKYKTHLGDDRSTSLTETQNQACCDAEVGDDAPEFVFRYLVHLSTWLQKPKIWLFHTLSGQSSCESRALWFKIF